MESGLQSTRCNPDHDFHRGQYGTPRIGVTWNVRHGGDYGWTVIKSRNKYGCPAVSRNFSIQAAFPSGHALYSLPHRAPRRYGSAGHRRLLRNNIPQRPD